MIERGCRARAARTRGAVNSRAPRAIISVTLKDKILFHQVHPAKLGTDVAAAVVSLYLLWQHELALGLLVHFIPPPIASAAVMGFASLDRYRNSSVGGYLRRYMMPGAQAARLIGNLITVPGAWFRSPLTVAAGLLVVAVAWSYGLVLDARQARRRDHGQPRAD
jgi:hypothetical protein